MLNEESKAQLAVARQNADKSDDAFLNRLEHGYKWQVHVANKLMLAGYAVQCQPLQVRPDRTQIEEYTDDYDLLVTRVGKGWKRHIEVKSRTMAFGSDPGTFPFATVIVEREETYSARKRLPSYWCMVSQATGACFAVGGVDVKSNHAVERKRGCDYIVTPKEFFVSFEEMLEQFPA